MGEDITLVQPNVCFANEAADTSVSFNSSQNENTVENSVQNSEAAIVVESQSTAENESVSDASFEKKDEEKKEDKEKDEPEEKQDKEDEEDKKKKFSEKEAAENYAALQQQFDALLQKANQLESEVSILQAYKKAANEEKIRLVSEKFSTKLSEDERKNILASLGDMPSAEDYENALFTAFGKKSFEEVKASAASEGTTVNMTFSNNAPDWIKAVENNKNCQ